MRKNIIIFIALFGMFLAIGSLVTKVEIKLEMSAQME